MAEMQAHCRKVSQRIKRSSAATRTRGLAAELAPTSGEVVKYFQPGSSRTDSAVRILAERVKHALLSYSTSAGASDIGSFLLCRVQSFFEADVAASEETATPRCGCLQTGVFASPRRSRPASGPFGQ
jgi:hypothetical protein